MIFRRDVTGFLNGQPFSLVVTLVDGGAYLRPDAAEAWANMKEAAAAAGVALVINGHLSGFRSSAEQAALRLRLGAFGEGGYAAAVNNSPHQTGTALDVAHQNPDNADFDSNAYAWLRDNAPSFGWYPVGDAFSTKEPWHFSYRGEA